MLVSDKLQQKMKKDKELEALIKELTEFREEYVFKYKLNYNSVMETKTLTLQEYVTEYHPYLAVDEDLVQRIFERWKDIAIQSYLIDLVTGNAVKDLILIADIQEIINEIENQLDIVEEDETVKINALNESYDYFNQYILDGKKYLLIDGKHRDDVIGGFFFPGNRAAEDVVTFKHKQFTELLVDPNTNLPVNVIGKRFQQLPADMQMDIYNRPIIVTIIKTGDIKRLQQHFVNTNSGVQLEGMEIRICSMSDVARFVRFLTNKNINPNTFSFFENVKALSKTGEKSLTKKGHMLLISNMINYYLNNVKSKIDIDFTTEKQLDSIFSYDFSLSDGDKSILSDVVKAISIGGWEVYSTATTKKSKSKNKNSTKLIKISWSDYVNLFILYSNALAGKTPYLKYNKKLIQIIQPKFFCESMIDILRELEQLDLYLLDSNGNTLMQDKDGIQVPVENEHSFKRANSVNNKENTLKKEALLLEAFDKKIQSLVDSGCVILLDQTRTQSLSKKRQSALAQGKKDAFTNKTLSWGQIDSGVTVNAHVESYADGHSEMVVGLAKPNSHSQKETIYTEKVKKQK
jgi:hypothetical protein